MSVTEIKYLLKLSWKSGWKLLKNEFFNSILLKFYILGIQNLKIKFIVFDVQIKNSEKIISR